MTPAPAVPEGARVTIRCAGHLNRAGKRVQARIAEGVRQGPDFVRQFGTRWDLQRPDGVRADTRHADGFLTTLEARADGTTLLPPGMSYEEFREAQSVAQRSEFDVRQVLRCRGCLSRADSHGGDLQAANRGELWDALDAVALAGRQVVTLPDLDTLIGIVKRRNRRG